MPQATKWLAATRIQACSASHKTRLYAISVNSRGENDRERQWQRINQELHVQNTHLLRAFILRSTFHKMYQIVESNLSDTTLSFIFLYREHVSLDDWLEDWFHNFPINWLTEWLTSWQTVWMVSDRVTDWQADLLAYSIYWLTDWLIKCMTDKLTACSVLGGNTLHIHTYTHTDTHHPFGVACQCV